MKNKIFLFSDLDDTLITSKRKIPDFNEFEFTVGGIKRDGVTPHSFFKNGTLQFLNILIDSKEAHLIPVTARDLTSYKRFVLSEDERIKYAIINFGGVILKNGKLDEYWNKHIKSQYNALDNQIKDIFDKSNEIIKEKKYKDKVKASFIDGYYIAFRYIQKGEKKKWHKKLKKALKLLIKATNQEYYIFENDSSVSILPHFLNKSKAVQHLIDKYEPSLTIGAGDNENDREFMKVCDFALVPKDTDNSELLNQEVKV